MAKIELGNKNNLKKHLTLEDCEIGDIVLLSEEIYIIIDGSSYSGIFLLLKLRTMEEEEFDCNTLCCRYQKSLYFDRSDFQEYEYAD